MSTDAARQRARRERQQALGKVRLQLWIDETALALLDEQSASFRGDPVRDAKPTQRLKPTDNASVGQWHRGSLI